MENVWLKLRKPIRNKKVEVKMPKTKEFISLQKQVKETYLGKPVPKKYQLKYGKKYDPKEVKSISYAIAKSKKIKIHKKRKRK